MQLGSEIRIPRRMPVDRAGLRGTNCSCSPSRCRSRRSPRPPARWSADPMTSPGRGFDHPRLMTRIREIRAQSGILVAIGACATAGGIRRCATSPRGRVHLGGPRPPSTSPRWRPPRRRRRTQVDYELRGCPIDRGQLLDTLAALLVGASPRLPRRPSATAECKRGHLT